MSTRYLFPGVIVASLIACLCLGKLRAEPVPLPPADQDKVNEALVGGVVFLKSTQPLSGSWPEKEGSHPTGYAALPGLTLLECGVPVSRSVIQRAASVVRLSSIKLENTYELALSILFLDRLIEYNDNFVESVVEAQSDRTVIQALALRLIAGQKNSGGWGYSCPLLNNPGEMAQLLKALKAKRIDRQRLPSFLKPFAVLRDPGRLMVPDKNPLVNQLVSKSDETDNSNTHFALLALWVAQRHDVPAEKSFKLLVKRFRSSQNTDGGWGYKYMPGGGAPEGPPLICAGLLGLALEYGFGRDVDTKGVPLASAALTQVSFAIGFPSPLALHLTAKAANRLAAAEAIAKKRTGDTHILNGFKALSKHVGQPAGRTVNLPPPNYYYLWTLERVAMLYDLKTIGEKDWYRWGAEALLANQKEDGHWEGPYGPTVDTCFALLFLKQSNLTEDLANRLKADQTVLAKPPPGKYRLGRQSLTEDSVPTTPPAASAPQPPRSPEAAPGKGGSIPDSKAPPSNKKSPEQPASKPLTTQNAAGPARRPPATAAAPPQDASQAFPSLRTLLLWVAGGAAIAAVAIGIVILLIVGRRGRPSADDEERAEPRRAKRTVSSQRHDGRKRDSARENVRKKKRPTAPEDD